MRNPDHERDKDASRQSNFMTLRPRKGDIWEVVIPGRPKRVKTVRSVYRVWYTLPWSFEKGSIQLRFPTVQWVRLSKGRYSSIRVKSLLKYGKLLSRGLPIDYCAHSGSEAVRRIRSSGIHV